jgi:RHS repeat-associated protein
LSKRTNSDFANYYVRDAQGNALATYSLKNDSLYLIEQNLYGSSQLGVKNLAILAQIDMQKLELSDTLRIFEEFVGAKNYELSNHLGNVLATISDKTIFNTDHYNGIVYSAQLYYPFGWEIPTLSFAAKSYRYGFNGVEKAREIGEGVNTTFYREQDTRAGRWWSVDPISHPEQTPYSMMDGNPIIGTDVDGADTRVKTKQKNGKEHIKISYRGVLIDRTGKITRKELKQIRKEIIAQLETSFTGESENRSWSIKVNLRVGDRPRKKGTARESTISLVSDGYNGLPFGQTIEEGTHVNGFDAFVNMESQNKVPATAAHEVGHTMGLPHIVDEVPELPQGINFFNIPPSEYFGKVDAVSDDSEVAKNLMLPGPFSIGKPSLFGTKILESQILHIRNDFEQGKLNRDDFKGSTEAWGIHSTDKPLFKFRYSTVLKKTIYEKRDE